MLKRVLWCTALAAALTGCQSTPVKQVAIQTVTEITDPSTIKPIAITKVVGKMKRGEDIGDWQAGVLCIRHGDINWRSGSKVNLTSEELADVFKEELEKNHWPVVGSTDDLFNGYDVSGAELLVAAKVKSIHANICYPMAGFGDFSSSKGAMRLSAEWQIYSPFTKSIIKTITTEGSTEVKEATSGGGDFLLADAFAIAVNNLLASPEFMQVAKQDDLSDVQAIASKLMVIPNKKTNYRKLSVALEAAKKSTVTIRTASGHGSGFVIGNGNLIMTNAHVVGDAKRVNVITSGGVTLTANVTKVNKSIDVALVQLNGITFKPLAVNIKNLESGSRVYAVGSPLDEGLKGTVTSGIVSGYRDYKGLNWLQSDTAINPGNSGGPLINEKGEVIAMSTAGLQAGGSQVGLNLFVPISIALAHSGLKVD